MTERIEMEFKRREAEGEARGESCGEVKATKRNILSMMKNTAFSDAEISRFLDVPVSEVSSLRMTTV